MYFNNWYTWDYVIENLKRLRKDEWAIIAPYFDKNNYRADKVIELLKI